MRHRLVGFFFILILCPLLLLSLTCGYIVDRVSKKYTMDIIVGKTNVCSELFEKYTSDILNQSEYFCSVSTEMMSEYSYLPSFIARYPEIKQVLVLDNSECTFELFDVDYSELLSEIEKKGIADEESVTASFVRYQKAFCIQIIDTLHVTDSYLSVVYIIEASKFRDMIPKEVTDTIDVFLIDSYQRVSKYPFNIFMYLETAVKIKDYNDVFADLANNSASGGKIQYLDSKNKVCIAKFSNGLNLFASGEYFDSALKYTKYKYIIYFIAVICVVLSVVEARHLSRKVIFYMKSIDTSLKDYNIGFANYEKIECSNMKIKDIIDVYLKNIKSLQSSEQRYRCIVEMSDNIVFEYDIKEDKVYFSDNFNKRFSFRAVSSSYKDSFFVNASVHPDDEEKFKDVLLRSFDDTNYHYGEYRFKNIVGQYVWYLMKATAHYDKEGIRYKVIGSFVDINKEKISETQLIERANYDSLTNLLNRETFIKRLEKEYELSLIRKNWDAILFIDIDNFKIINDLYGHSGGDYVLKYFGFVLERAIDGNGFAGRYGGDEFILCLNSQNTYVKAPQLAKMILEEMKKGVTLEDSNQHLDISCSIGISYFTKNNQDIEKVINDADKAMYDVKKNGKSGFSVYK